jgi:chromosome partitioning protein
MEDPIRSQLSKIHLAPMEVIEMAYIIAIANEKGGVGKTTTVLSLGAALVERGLRVLLVDLDPQANLTLSFGIKPHLLERSVADILMGGQRISSVIQRTSIKDLDLAPANEEMRLTEQFLRIRERFDQLLKEALEEVSSYDIILLDCPPAVGSLTQSALTAAQLLILPSQCEFFSTHALRSSLNIIRTIRERNNPRLRYRLLLTMIDPENQIHQNLSRQIRKAFGDAVLKTSIELDHHLSESPLHAQPITAMAPESLGAQQYRELAEEVLHFVRETSGKLL